MTLSFHQPWHTFQPIALVIILSSLYCFYTWRHRPNPFNPLSHAISNFICTTFGKPPPSLIINSFKLFLHCPLLLRRDHVQFPVQYHFVVSKFYINEYINMLEIKVHFYVSQKRNTIFILSDKLLSVVSMGKTTRCTQVTLTTNFLRKKKTSAIIWTLQLCKVPYT